MQQAQETSIGVLVAAVWRSREQQHVAALVLGEALEQGKALLSAALRAADAGVSFVDYDQTGAGVGDWPGIGSATGR